MKRKLIALGVLGAGLLIIVGVSAFSQRSNKAACQSFIEQIISGDSEGSYKQFSANAQASTHSDTWASQVRSLSGFYDGARLEFSSVSTIETGEGQQTHEQFTATTGASNFTLHCFVSESGEVDGFSSQVNEPTFDDEQEGRTQAE